MDIIEDNLETFPLEVITDSAAFFCSDAPLTLSSNKVFYKQNTTLWWVSGGNFADQRSTLNTQYVSIFRYRILLERGVFLYSMKYTFLW
jgi:hypothetical protein